MTYEGHGFLRDSKKEIGEEPELPGAGNQIRRGMNKALRPPGGAWSVTPPENLLAISKTGPANVSLGKSTRLTEGCERDFCCPDWMYFAGETGLLQHVSS